MRVLQTLAGAALCALTAVPSLAAEKLPLDGISDYLNGLKTAKADFTQVNSDGSISTGRIFIKRPGRVRFEYNPPEKVLVLAHAGAVAILDPKSNQPPESYPLNRTPLSIILADTVDLARARMVTGHDFDGTATIVRAQDPDHPEYGFIEMKFTDDPVELRQWVIHDGAGGETTMILGALESGLPLKNSLFNIELQLKRAN